MKIQLFTIRIDGNHLVTDQNRLNDFLDNVIFKKSSTQFIAGKPNSWSVLIHYLNKENVSKEIKEQEEVYEQPVQELTQEQQGDYEYIRQWRNSKSKEEMLAPFMILSNKSIKEIVAKKPEFEKDLLNIHGIGKAKVEKYGSELIALIDTIRCN